MERGGWPFDAGAVHVLEALSARAPVPAILSHVPEIPAFFANEGWVVKPASTAPVACHSPQPEKLLCDLNKLQVE